MLTSDCLADSEAAVYKHCVGMGWTVNESRSRDLACLSDSWMLGKMKVISNAVIDKIQAYPRPMRVEAVAGIRGYTMGSDKHLYHNYLHCFTFYDG